MVANIMDKTVLYDTIDNLQWIAFISEKQDIFTSDMKLSLIITCFLCPVILQIDKAHFLIRLFMYLIQKIK